MNNPQKLNPLQLKTLTLLQELARNPDNAYAGAVAGEMVIGQIPHAHGDHFHVGRRVVMSRDATGLHNPAVYVALERKGLARAEAGQVTLTAAGLEYTTGLRDVILHGSDH